MAVNTALIGAGLFSKDIYSGLFKNHKEIVNLSYVWSRSEPPATQFCTEFTPEAKPVHGDAGLDVLLADEAVKLFVLVLPVQVALGICERALAAGKNVIMEKPVSGTVADATASIAKYHALPGENRPLWCLAENYRYEEVFLAACRMTPSLGTIIKMDLVADLPMDERNKYYVSQWRRDVKGCPGGMLMDSSVHFVAALRMVAASCGLGEASAVTCQANHAKPDLSGPDSIVGVVKFANGTAPASVSISLAASHVDFSLKVVGTDGTLEITRGGWTGGRGEYLLSWKLAGDAAPSTQKYGFSGMPTEFKAFVRLMTADEVDEELLRSSPEEGARDLALMEALLKSGESGGQVTPVTQIQ
eukprot:gene21930-28976_t